MIQCYSNSIVICLLVICLGVGACSEPQDVAGSCKGDLEETTNANTHLLARACSAAICLCLRYL